MEVAASRIGVDWKRLRNRPWHNAGRSPVVKHISCSTVKSFPRAAPLCSLVLVTVLLWLRPASAAPVSVRFVEGVTHGFLVLRTADGVLIASGDLLQLDRGGQVENRMVFHFKDESVSDDRVAFTQHRVFITECHRM